LLPLLGGVFPSLRNALDASRRTYRYRQLAERLTTAAKTIAALNTESATRRHILATEEILLDERIEWKLAEEQNGGH
jgi:hypothetical protein